MPEKLERFWKNSDSGMDMVDHFFDNLRDLKRWGAEFEWTLMWKQFKTLLLEDIDSVVWDWEEKKSDILKWRKKYDSKLVLEFKGIEVWYFDETEKWIEKFAIFMLSLVDYIKAYKKEDLYEVVEKELAEHASEIVTEDLYRSAKKSYESQVYDKKWRRREWKKRRDREEDLEAADDGKEREIFGALKYLSEITEAAALWASEAFIMGYISNMETKYHQYMDIIKKVPDKDMTNDDINAMKREISADLIVSIAAIEHHLDQTRVTWGLLAWKRAKFDRELGKILSWIVWKNWRSSKSYKKAMRIVKADAKASIGIGPERYAVRAKRLRDKYLRGGDSEKTEVDEWDKDTPTGKKGWAKRRASWWVGWKLDLPPAWSRAESINITAAPKWLLTLVWWKPSLNYNMLTINQLINGVVIVWKDGEVTHTFNGVLDTFNEDGTLKMWVTWKETEWWAEKIRLQFLQRALGSQAGQSARMMKLLWATSESLNPQLWFERFIKILENDIVNSEWIKSYQSQFDASAWFLVQALRYPESVRKQSLTKAWLSNIAAMTDGLDISSEDRIYAAGLGNYLTRVDLEGVTSNSVSTFFKWLTSEPENSTVIADYSRRVFEEKVEYYKKNGFEWTVERVKVNWASALAWDVWAWWVENNLLTPAQAQALPRYTDGILEIAQNGTDIASEAMLRRAGIQWVVGFVRRGFGSTGNEGNANFDSMFRSVWIKNRNATTGATDRGINLWASYLWFAAMSETAEFARGPAKWIDKTLWPEWKIAAVGAMLSDGIKTEKNMIDDLRNPYLVLDKLDSKNKETILDMALWGLTWKELSKVISKNKDNKSIKIDQKALRKYIILARPLIGTLSDEEFDRWILNTTRTVQYAINEKSGVWWAYEFEKLEEMFESDRKVRDIMDEVWIERSKERKISGEIAVAFNGLPAWLAIEDKQKDELKDAMQTMDKAERLQIWQVMKFVSTQYGLINNKSKLADGMVWLDPVSATDPADLDKSVEMINADAVSNRLMVEDTEGVTGKKRLNTLLKTMIVPTIHKSETYEDIQDQYLKTLQVLYGGDIVEQKNIPWIIGTRKRSEWNEFVGNIFFPKEPSWDQTFGTRYEWATATAKYGQIDWDVIDIDPEDLIDDTYILAPGVDTIDTDRDSI